MVVGAEHQSRDVWHGEADEGDGSAESSGHGGEQSGDEEQVVAHALCVDAQVFGVLFAQEECVERFDEQEREEQSEQGDACKGRHLPHGDASEVAESPHHV